jgi:hypothetical protein
VVPVALLIGLFACTATPASAGTVIGMGVFGGTANPTGGEYDKTKESGTSAYYGIRVPFNFSKALSLEPYMARTDGSQGDSAYAAPGLNKVRDGYDVTAYGVNVGIGRLVGSEKGKFRMAPFGGIAMHKMRRENGPSDDVFGWEAGLALGMNTSNYLSWDLRGSYNGISSLPDEESGRNYIHVSLGLTCVLSPR